MLKKLLRAGGLPLVVLAILCALPSSRRAIAGSFTALTEYAYRFIQVAPSGLPANCGGTSDCIYVSSTDDKAYHRNASGSAISLEGGGGSVSITCGSGLSCSPSTITGTGVISSTGGVTWPLQNGTSTNTLLYGGTMTGSSTALSTDTTNAYTTGDVALNIKSAGTSALKIGFNFGAAFPEIQSQTANLLMLNITGDGWAAQGTNFSYWYGAGTTQVEFLANNGMRPVSGFPLYNGTVDAPWSSVGSKWEAAPLGASLASASTVTPTQSAHPLTGTTTVNTIATTNIPTGTATVVVSETFICAAACVFGTSGNISYGFTGVAGGSYTFIWNGTSWIPPAATTVPPADNTGSIGTTSPLMRWATVAALTLTAGSTGLTLTGASTPYLLNATGFDLSGSGSWSIASQNATAFSFGKSGITSTAKGSFALATQAATMTATTTVTPSSGGVVKLTYASTVNVTTMTLSAGVDGQELVVMLIQPAAGTAATMATTWTNVNFAAGVGSFTATLAKRDVYAFVYDGTTSKWYERSRSLNEPN